MAAQGAAVGPEEPMDGLFHGVANADATKINRSAMRTARGKHSLLVSFLTVSFRGTAGALDVIAAEGRRRTPHITVVTAASSGPASFPGGLDLFRRPQVGLG
jgi:hypothetical protein